MTTRRMATTATLLLLLGGALGACTAPPTTGPAPEATARPAASMAPTASVIPTAQPDAVGLRPLVGTTWVAERFDGPVTAGPAGQRPLLRLAPDGTFVAHDGCNAISGTYTSTGEALTFAAASVGRTACPTNPWSGFADALGRVTTAQVGEGGLALGQANRETLLGFHALVHADAPAAEGVEVRVRNGTGRDIASVDVIAWGGRLSFGALPAGATSAYAVPPGDVARYAGLDLTYPDAERVHRVATDYVGETPLPAGRYTYVLVDRPDIGVVTALEEEGAIGPQAFR